MAKKSGKRGKDTPIRELSAELMQMFDGLFGNCIENDGIFRSVADNIGVVASKVIVETALEGGVDEEDTDGVLHFVSTIAENIPKEAVSGLLVSLNALNHEVSCGDYPGFGTFCYYEPLNQVYLSYRLPVKLDDPGAQYDNIRSYLTVLYDELDMFVDFIMFSIADPGRVDITDYMEYLDEV